MVKITCVSRRPPRLETMLHVSLWLNPSRPEAQLRKDIDLSANAQATRTSLRRRRLEGLLTSCMPQLVRTARQIVRNPQDSDDVLQDSLLSAFRHLDQFEGRGQFTTWMYSIIRNAARTHYRKNTLHPMCSLDCNDSEEASSFVELSVDPNPNAEEAYAKKERSQILQARVGELRPSYRSAIRLCDIYGIDYMQAAAMLGTSVSALKTCLHRARRSLRKMIKTAHRVDRFDVCSAINRTQARSSRRLN